MTKLSPVSMEALPYFHLKGIGSYAETQLSKID